MSNCPNCKTTTLVPSKIEQGLPAKSCNQCSGALVNLLSYRNWLDEGGDLTSSTTFKPLDVHLEETKKALQCPKCQHLMRKFRIDSETDNRVDVCLACDEAWLDEGEWTLLKQLELQNKLATITTEPWQIRVKKEKAHQAVEKDLINELGQADYSKAQKIKAWLNEHPKKATLLRFIK